MPEPIRDQILDSLVARLQTMTGVRPWGGSYPTTITVNRYFTQIQEIERLKGGFPHLIVIDAPGSTLKEDRMGSANQEIFLHEFNVVIYGYVKADGTASRARWMQRLWDDVVRTLLANRTLTGLVRHLTIDEPLETDAGLLDPFGAFAQPVKVWSDEPFNVN